MSSDAESADLVGVVGRTILVVSIAFAVVVLALSLQPGVDVVSFDLGSVSAALVAAGFGAFAW